MSEELLESSHKPCGLMESNIAQCRDYRTAPLLNEVPPIRMDYRIETNVSRMGRIWSGRTNEDN
ncbi:hypothetical protein ZHAS_00004066 [Anopheles sinensis]|uniref:Uncharacterized protein n=1 Tax=Anopheles sinensis TaxID=74873 RepID=A0A084VG03_ANOSI|nr:hypothetical protein ZHAS_00004066 [Anopheles sinensis]